MNVMMLFRRPFAMLFAALFVLVCGFILCSEKVKTACATNSFLFSLHANSGLELRAKSLRLTQASPRIKIKCDPDFKLINLYDELNKIGSVHSIYLEGDVLCELSPDVAIRVPFNVYPNWDVKVSLYENVGSFSGGNVLFKVRRDETFKGVMEFILRNPSFKDCVIWFDFE